MNGPDIHLTLAPELRLFAAPNRRADRVPTPTDGASSLGHVVESAGVPLTEVGRLLVDGREVPVSYVPQGGQDVEVLGVTRPQQVPG
ncbi:hypothetical protein EF918_36185, partial [Streptomyces sp. WAC06614]